MEIDRMPLYNKISGIPNISQKFFFFESHFGKIGPNALLSKDFDYVWSKYSTLEVIERNYLVLQSRRNCFLLFIWSFSVKKSLSFSISDIFFKVHALRTMLLYVSFHLLFFTGWPWPRWSRWLLIFSVA